MPVTVEDMGYCPAGLGSRLLSLVGQELAAVELAAGHPIALSVFGLTTRPLPRRQPDAVPCAAVYRRDDGDFEMMLNPAALTGAVPRRPERLLEDEARLLARQAWAAARLRSLPLLPGLSDSLSLREVPAWRLDWARAMAEDARTISRVLQERFPSVEAFVAWCGSGLLMASSEEALPAGSDSLWPLVAHEMGHVWYLETRLGRGEGRSAALRSSVLTMPPPPTLRGVGQPHEAAAEAWSLGRVAAGMLEDRRPDLAAWLGAGNPATMAAGDSGRE